MKEIAMRVPQVLGWTQVRKNAEQLHREEQEKTLLADIRRVVTQLEEARLYYCEITDPDLIDAQIYWMKCLEARYACLIRRAREAGLSGGGQALLI